MRISKQAETGRESGPVVDGIQRHRMRSWRDFFDFVETVVFDESLDEEPSLIWRGQRDDSWVLEPSIDRYFRSNEKFLGADPEQLERESLRIVENFEHAARGRRGPNPKKLTPNEWWALGQHHGLATPLLDWTRSPFAALYFAFEEAPPKDQSEFRVVFALDRHAVDQINQTFEDEPIEGFVPILAIIDPLSDDNPRLVSQGGVLTRGPAGVSVEQWVQINFSKASNAVLLRIEVPAKDRIGCLSGLDRMNINHLSLFPDLTGAARYVNMRAELSASRTTP